MPLDQFNALRRAGNSQIDRQPLAAISKHARAGPECARAGVVCVRAHARSSVFFCARLLEACSPGGREACMTRTGAGYDVAVLRHESQVFAGAITLVYNHPQLADLVFSRGLIDAIFLGTVNSWSNRHAARARASTHTVACARTCTHTLTTAFENFEHPHPSSLQRPLPATTFADP